APVRARARCLFFPVLRRPPSAPLFPYTTLFRSRGSSLREAPQRLFVQFTGALLAVAGDERDGVSLVQELYGVGGLPGGDAQLGGKPLRKIGWRAERGHAGQNSFFFS